MAIGGQQRLYRYPNQILQIGRFDWYAQGLQKLQTGFSTSQGRRNGLSSAVWVLDLKGVVVCYCFGTGSVCLVLVDNHGLVFGLVLMGVVSSGHSITGFRLVLAGRMECTICGLGVASCVSGVI